MGRNPEPWNPLEGMSEEHNDKSQDVDWLRGGFLARGAQVDGLEKLSAELLKALKRQRRKANVYRALFGFTLGILLTVVFV